MLYTLFFYNPVQLSRDKDRQAAAKPLYILLYLKSNTAAASTIGKQHIHMYHAA